MKRIRLNKLIISPSFVVCAAKAQHGPCDFSSYLYSFLSTHISESIGVIGTGADVTGIEVFTTIQLPK